MDGLERRRAVWDGFGEGEWFGGSWAFGRDEKGVGNSWGLPGTAGLLMIT
jgi:hypothetical protein